MIRRTRAGLKWWQPDTLHLHHRLLAIGHSHAHAVLIMYLWTAILTFGAASFAFVPARTALVTIAGAGVVAALLTAGLPWLQRRVRGSDRTRSPECQKSKGGVRNRRALVIAFTSDAGTAEVRRFTDRSGLDAHPQDRWDQVPGRAERHRIPPVVHEFRPTPEKE